LLAQGKTETEITAALVLSPKTIATQIQNVLRKLRVHSRTQAVVVAYRDGLVETAKSLPFSPQHPIPNKSNAPAKMKW
jgi:Bacterial regulatory proteins, luxR family